MVVDGDRLECGGVGVGQGPAGRPEDFPYLEFLERPRFDDRKCGWIELVQEGGGWLRTMAERAGATTSEAPGSHAIYVSRPAVVVDVIVAAAQNALENGKVV